MKTSTTICIVPINTKPHIKKFNFGQTFSKYFHGWILKDLEQHHILFHRLSQLVPSIFHLLSHSKRFTDTTLSALPLLYFLNCGTLSFVDNLTQIHSKSANLSNSFCVSICNGRRTFEESVVLLQRCTQVKDRGNKAEWVHELHLHQLYQGNHLQILTWSVYLDCQRHEGTPYEQSNHNSRIYKQESQE